MRDLLYQPRPHVQAAESAQQARDRRFVRSILTRIDLIEDEMASLEARGAAHFERARACLAQLDALATAHFRLLVAVARIEARLVQVPSQQAEAAQ